MDYLQRIQDEMKHTTLTNYHDRETLARLLSQVMMGDITEAEAYFNQVRIAPPHQRLNKHLHTVPTFRVGLSNAFHNKENLTGNKAAMAGSFKVHEVTPEQFIVHVLAGKAWTPGTFTGNHRVKTKLISAQIIALDCDDHISVDNAIMEFLICEYALLIHASPSSTPEHPKTRVIFLLQEPIDQCERYETITRGMLAHFAHLRPDKACKDVARFFYGSDIGEYNASPNAVLPMAIAGCFTEDEAHEDYWTIENAKQRASMPTRPMTSEQVSKYVETAYNAELSLLQSAPHKGRHAQLFKSAANIGGMVKGGWGITEGEAERDLIRACGSFASDKDIPEITRIIQDAFRVATARNLEVRR